LEDIGYNRMTEEDRVAEYVKAISLLTIDSTQRLKQENEELRKDYLAELGDLREEFNEMKIYLANLDKERQKKLVNEFFQRSGDELQDQCWKSEA
jgi:hypothetical protein